jgi:hypothetical protein
VIIEKGMGEGSGSLKLPVAPPSGISAALQQAAGNALAVHFHDWCVKEISYD